MFSVSYLIMAMMVESAEAVVVAAANIGLVFTVFTRQPLAAPGFYFALYVLVYVWGKLRAVEVNDQAAHSDLLYDTVMLPWTTLMAGVLVGATFVWALSSPLLVDTALFFETRQPYREGNSWRALFYPWHWVWFLGFVAAAIGFYIWDQDYFDEIPPDIKGLNPETSAGWGIALLVVGVLLILLGGCCACALRMPSNKPGYYTIGFSVALLALIGLPEIFYLTRESLGFYSVLLTFGVAFVLYVLFAFFTQWDGVFAEESVSLFRRIEFWVLLFIVEGTLLGVGLTAAEFYQEGTSTAIVVLIICAVFFVLLWLYGLVLSRCRYGVEERFLPGVGGEEQSEQRPLVEASTATRSLDALTLDFGTKKTTLDKRSV